MTDSEWNEAAALDEEPAGQLSVGILINEFADPNM